MTATRHRLVITVGAVVLAGLAACSPALVGPASTPSSTLAPRPSPAPSPALSPAPTPGTTVPMRVVRHDGAGAGCLVADVAAGGGAPVPVVIDTGSSGLMLDAGAFGPDVEPTGRRRTASFLNAAPFPVDEVRAPVAVGGPDGTMIASTPGPIAVASLPTPQVTDGQSGRCGPVRGVLGIGLGNSDAAAPALTSPLSQLPRPLSDGFAVTVTGTTGTITLGRPAVTPRSTTLPLVRANGSSPDGRPAYQRDVVLCWTVGPDHGCGPTDIDTGAPLMLVRPDLLPTADLPTLPPGRTGPPLPTGTPVTISAPDGAPLLHVTTGSDPPEHRLAVAALFGNTEANAGLGFFEHATVGYDLDAGQAVLTPR